MSKFIALLCAATVAVSASAVFAAESNTTSDDAAATATAAATADPDATETPAASADPDATEDPDASASPEATESAAPAEETAAPLPFTDVDADAYYADAVALCYEEGLFNGVSETLFSPDTTMTRAMFATVFARMENADLTAEYELTYVDVPADSFYAPYIAWATEQGIMEGYGADLFGPDDAITREQAAKMLYSYMAGKTDEELTAEAADYTDIALVNDWAAEAINYNTVIGYLLEDASGNINPQAPISRADACYAVATVIEALAEEDAATEAPAETADPAATVDPDATEAPEATADPDATEAPEATADPDATEAPEASASPAATATPAAE